MASNTVVPRIKIKQKLSTAKNALRAVRDGAISASELAKLEKELKGLSASADGPTKTQLDRVAKQLNEAKDKVKPRVKLKADTQPTNSAPKPRVKPKPKAEPKPNTRGAQKPAGKGTLKNITDATARTGSRIGKLAKAGSGIGALLAADEVGAGSDVVPAGRRDEFVKKMDAERRAKEKAQGRGRGDGAKETATRRAAQEDKKRVDAATNANKADAERSKLEKDKKRVDAATKANKTDKNGTYKIKKGDTLSEIAQKHGLKTKELAKKNNIKEPDKIYAGRTLKLNKGGYANCGASMRPTQKSSRGIK
jgi:LysM repeat protein